MIFVYRGSIHLNPSHLRVAQLYHHQRSFHRRNKVIQFIMSGIPIYTSCPINASKVSGATTQTAAPGTQTNSLVPKPVPATQTASSSTISYPSAQPGAALPAPTGSVQRHTPVQPRPTTKTDNEGPPPPQPGAFPVPPRTSNIAPPPKARESYRSPTNSKPQPYPAQMLIPPPRSSIGAQPPTSSTGTSITASSAYPATIPAAEYAATRRSIEHPPGYQQNSYASELSSGQRHSHDASNNSLGGLGGYGGADQSKIIDTESVWNTAKQWVSAAGNKLSETEQEIWRRINKE